MAEVEEFELQAQPTAPGPEPAPPPRPRSDRPGTWVAAAAAAVALGLLAVPSNMPRPNVVVPVWGGLGGALHTTIDARLDPLDAVALASRALDGFTAYDAGGRIMGTVVVLTTDPALPTEPPADFAEASTEILLGMPSWDELFLALESTGAASDWVCQPVSDQATCTALADPEITLTVDWPT